MSDSVDAKAPQSRSAMGDAKNNPANVSNKLLPGFKRRGSDFAASVVELSTDNNTPGVLRIFGDSVRPGTHYKSVLATIGSTACELVKEALSRYNILEQKTGEYLLCEVIGKFDECSVRSAQTKSTECRNKPNGDGNKGPDLDLENWNSEYVRIIDEHDRPLLLQELWKPMEGYARRFEIRRKDDVLKSICQDKTTTGINSNARKIQMAKVKPGVIPRGAENDEQRRKSPLQLPRKESITVANVRRSSSRTDSSSSVDSLSYGAYYPDRHSELPKAPTNCPFLLTLRGFDIRRDKLYYLIEDDICVLGGLTQPTGKAPSVVLNAPDVLSQHCCLCRRRMQSSSRYSETHQIVEIEPEPGAKVTVNGWAVYSRIVLASGDLITIGDHYVFLYKDLTAGQDIPMELPWLQDCGRTHSPQTSPVEFSSPEEDEKIFEFGDKTRVNSKDEFFGRTMKRRKQKLLDKWQLSDGSDDGARPRFSYSKESEDELIRAVITLVDPFEDSYKLSPAFIYSLCLDYSSHTFGLSHTKKLVFRILTCLREITLKCSSVITEDSLGERGVGGPQGRCRDDLHHARPVVFWMSNCLQLHTFVKKYILCQDGDDCSSISDPQNKSTDKEKILSQFEEIIKFGFQQTVYSTTKVLYHCIPLLLDSNPFEEECKTGSADVISILEDIYELSSSLELNSHVRKQIFTYLFFFISTSVFNKLMSKGSGNRYFSWHAGVRIAGNLQQLEEWAGQFGFQEDFQDMFKELVSAVDLLATAKGKVMQMTWKTLRQLAPNLNPAQLHHILQEYQVGSGKEVPSGWVPDQEDLQIAMDSGSVQIKLADHPPFSLPEGDVCAIDLREDVSDSNLLEHLTTITSTFGLSEDDDDSGYSVSNTPRLQSGSKLDASESFSFSDDGPMTRLKLPPRIGKPSAGNLLGVKSGNLSQSKPITFNLQARDRGSISHSSQDGDISEELDCSEIQLSFREHSTVSKVPLTSSKLLQEKAPSLTNDATAPIAGNISKGFGQVPNAKFQIWKTAGWQDSFCIDVPSVAPSVDKASSGLRVLSLEEAVVNSNSFDAGTSESDSDCAILGGPCGGDVPAMTAMNTAYLKDSHEDVVRVNLQRDKTGLGLGLIDGMHTSLHCPGLFVRTVVPGSPADKNGRIRIGDKLLAVNGTTLLGADYQTAMTIIRNAGTQLQLVIARNDDDTAQRLSSTTC